MKNLFVKIRSSLKIIFLLIACTGLIIAILGLIYKPSYAVTVDGEFIGYTANKSKLQNKINEYIKTGDGKNIAFVDIEVLPEYDLCLIRKDKITNDDEMFDRIKGTGTTYYEYYAITLGKKEKYYVGTKKEAEKIINELKKKDSENISKIAYAKVQDTKLKKFKESKKIIADLYVPKVTYDSYGSIDGGFATYANSYASSSTKLNLGIKFIRPISGDISSRYGERGGHSGLDIAGSYGTTIYAAASGTVVYAGSTGTGYGIAVKIAHGNGIETLYAHCSRVLVKAGQSVSQGQAIAERGSTGNSTGPHLHFEIRKNGTSLNPQNYIY